MAGSIVAGTHPDPSTLPELNPIELGYIPRDFIPSLAHVPNGIAQLDHDICSGPGFPVSKALASYETDPFLGHRFSGSGGVKRQVLLK